jgi:hypothetical protein
MRLPLARLPALGRVWLGVALLGRRYRRKLRQDSKTPSLSRLASKRASSPHLPRGCCVAMDELPWAIAAYLNHEHRPQIDRLQ